MANTIEGSFSAAPYRFGIVVSRFNEFITKRLLAGALDCLRKHGAEEQQIDIVHCPGAFEIAQVAQELIAGGNHDAIICLGCVIRGSTPHFDYICSAVTTAITKLSLESPVPVLFGVLTTESLEQAIERAGAKAGNKGWDAAMAAIEMADVRNKISGKKKK